MSRPTTQKELLERSRTDFEKLMSAVDAVPSDRREGPSAYPRGSVKDMLAHLDVWHELFLEWERIGRTGIVPPIPAEGYTWRTLPDFNMSVHKAHLADPWDDVATRLRDSNAAVREVVASYDDHDLFEKKRYRWTGSTSVGAYAVSATTSHYDWAMKLLRKSQRAWSNEPDG